MGATLEKLLAIVARDGLQAVYVTDRKGAVVPRGAAVAVTRFTRGRGTESVAYYRAASSGYLREPWHIELDFEYGYRLSQQHASEWSFKLPDGQTSPLADPSHLWACFGTSWECRALEKAQDTAKEAEEQARARTVASMYMPKDTAFAATSSVKRTGKRVKTTRQPRKQAARLSDAQALIAALTAQQGVVLDHGVRVISANRFKSYYVTLRDTWVALGGSTRSLEAQVQRSEVELLTAAPGYGGPGFMGDRGAQILEYVVHDDLVIADGT